MKIALIPARGGSKRIPRKNIKSFCGQPIIAYSIKAALDSGLFDKVVVSTEDPEIAEVARSCGAQTPFQRPDALSTDAANTVPVIKHAIEWFRDNDEPLSHVCCILATAPFLQDKYLRQGYAAMMEGGCSYSFAATSFPFPIQRSFRLTEQGGVEMFWPEHYSTRSQDLEEAYHDAGQFYWGKAEAFLRDEMVFSNASRPVILPRHLVQDIDTMEDWTRAEYMFKALNMMDQGAV